jgi:hypothetical protein
MFGIDPRTDVHPQNRAATAAVSAEAERRKVLVDDGRRPSGP